MSKFCRRSNRSTRTLPEGLEQKSMSHPQQQPHFKHSQSNFAMLIRSTECNIVHLSGITDTDQVTEIQTATCKQKRRPTKKHIPTRAPSIPSRNQCLSTQLFSYHKYKQSQRKSFTSSHSHVMLQNAPFLSIPLYL